MHSLISGIIIGVIAVIGVWCVWYENHSSSDKDHDQDQ